MILAVLSDHVLVFQPQSIILLLYFQLDFITREVVHTPCNLYFKAVKAPACKSCFLS